MSRIRTLIMGAAGRDFHLFNTRFREDPTHEVIAFTATQIPFIVGRDYPPELAGPQYPRGIPIYDESDLTDLIKKENIEQVWFAYSDVPYNYLMSRASVVEAAGADFVLPDFFPTMIPAEKPIISVCAVRTGCGKSQTTRLIASILKDSGLKTAVVRHPMPYGKLLEQRCQRFETVDDLKKHKCTIEEMEEYEPHIDKGFLVFAGVDYGDILAAAQKEADVVLWDGGNNDLPFFKPDLHIVVTDPHRVGHESLYFPSEINARLADVFVINKEDSAEQADIDRLTANLGALQPQAQIVHAESPVTVEDPSVIEGKRVLCVEDGPTLTHGEMSFGAGVIAARNHGAAEIVDPRPWVTGTIAETFEKYKGIGALLPAMGYSDEQIRDLEATINASDVDAVVIGTPIDLTRLVKINKPFTRVSYDLGEKGDPKLSDIVKKFLAEKTGK